jgi:hypothetical protein
MKFNIHFLRPFVYLREGESFVESFIGFARREYRVKNNFIIQDQYFLCINLFLFTLRVRWIWKANRKFKIGEIQ